MHSEKIVKQKRKLFWQRIEAATRGVLWEKVYLKTSKNIQENICARTHFSEKETPAKMFSCEFCELSTEYLWTTASERRYCIDNFVM